MLRLRVVKKGISILGALTLLSGSALAQTTQGKVEVVVDNSTSMRPWKAKTKELVKNIKDFLEEKGINVELYSFGARIKPLRNASLLKANELDTNYEALLKHLENSQNTLAIIISDGRIPSKRFKDITKIKEEGASLNDAGNVICTLTVKEPTNIVKSFSTVAGSFKEYKEVLDKCLNLWETLQDQQNRENSVTATAPSPTPPNLIKVVNEEGFRSLEAQKPSTRVEASGTQVEIIIKQK